MKKQTKAAATTALTPAPIKVPAKLANPQQVRKYIASIAKSLHKGELTPQHAVAIGNLLKIVLQDLRAEVTAKQSPGAGTAIQININQADLPGQGNATIIEVKEQEAENKTEEKEKGEAGNKEQEPEEQAQ